MITQQDPRFRNLERKIGLFTLAALAGILVVIILVGAQKDLFSPKYQIIFTVDRGTGFTKGMPVKLSGFRIGRITNMILNEQAMVDITVEIARKYSKWIRTDSTVKLVKEGLVGDSIVEIAVGSLDKPEVKPGESIIYLKTKGLDELADEIGEKIKPVLIEIRNIVGYINDPDGDLKKTVQNLEILTRNLEITRKSADNLINTTSVKMELIGERTTTLLETANSKIDSLELEKINSTLTKLPPILEKTDTVMANAAEISGETKKLSRQIFHIIPGILSRTEELLFSTDRLVNSLNKSWLLGGGTETVPLHTFKAGDSHD